MRKEDQGRWTRAQAKWFWFVGPLSNLSVDYWLSSQSFGLLRDGDGLERGDLARSPSLRAQTPEPTNCYVPRVVAFSVLGRKYNRRSYC